LFSEIFDKVTGAIEYSIINELPKMEGLKFHNVQIRKDSDNNHQSTNEWGAIKLASNFGIDSNTLQFKWPRHLYFKSLIKSLHTNTQLVAPNHILHGHFKKILLIDDNAENGWGEVLRIIFNCTVESRVTNMELNVLRNVNPNKCQEYDLILLDLYLDNTKTDNSKALSLLRFVKNKFPEIPVIIYYCFK